MAYILLCWLILVALIQTGESFDFNFPTPEENVNEAIGNLSDLGYMSMALTLEHYSQTHKLPSRSFTIFAAPDTVFINSGQLSLSLFQYHVSTETYSGSNLVNLPYGTKIPTLLPNQNLVVTTLENDGGKISINNVQIDYMSPIVEAGYFAIYAIDRFFQPSYQITRGCTDPYHSDEEFDNEIAKASKFMLSRGYSIMSSSLDLQLRGLEKESTRLTIFAVADSGLAPYSRTFRLGSVFHRHFLPCRLRMSDLWGFNNGTMLPTLDKDFSVQVSVSEEMRLLLNDVPIDLDAPEMYMTDSIVVHGLNQIIPSLNE